MTRDCKPHLTIHSYVNFTHQLYIKISGKYLEILAKYPTFMEVYDRKTHQNIEKILALYIKNFKWEIHRNTGEQTHLYRVNFKAGFVTYLSLIVT